MIDTDKTYKNLAQEIVFIFTSYQQYLKKRLKNYGVGLSEYPVLIYLVHRDTPEARTSQSDIAQHQYRDPALITRATRSLADKGLINIDIDESNRTRHILSLTPDGREIAKMVDSLVWEWEEQAYADMTDDDRKQITRLLSKLETPE